VRNQRTAKSFGMPRRRLPGRRSFDVAAMQKLEIERLIGPTGEVLSLTIRSSVSSTRGFGARNGDDHERSSSKQPKPDIEKKKQGGRQRLRSTSGGAGRNLPGFRCVAVTEPARTKSGDNNKSD
jgi:hypothetical protein